MKRICEIKGLEEIKVDIGLRLNDFICIWEQDVLRSIKAKDKNKATEKLFVHSDIYENYFKNCVDKIK